MKIYHITALAFSLLLSACSTNKETLSASQAQEHAELAYLPLLTVASTNATQGGYTAQLSDKNGTPFTATVNKEKLGESYTTLSKGDTVKIIGDYTDNDIVEIDAERIVFIK